MTTHVVQRTTSVKLVVFYVDKFNLCNRLMINVLYMNYNTVLLKVTSLADY